MIRTEEVRVRAGNKGFTLLELSIVLVIIAVVSGMAIQSGVSVLATTRLSATQTKMKGIENALMAFLTTQNRLPCPADLTITKGSANYGVEAAVPGACIGGAPAANFTADGNSGGTAAEGAVPTATLGMSSDFMYDGWGNRFRYVVGVDITSPAASVCGPLTVNDASGNARTTQGLYAIISHGANGHGAYTSNGVTMNAGSVNTNELTNCHCKTDGSADTYEPTYVQRDVTRNPANALDSFDDLVDYKEGWQLRTNWDSVRTFCPVPPDLLVSTVAAHSRDVFHYKIISGVYTLIAGDPASYPPTNGANRISVTNDGKYAAVGAAFDVGVTVYSRNGDTMTKLLPDNDVPLYSWVIPVLSPDGNYLATGGYGYGIYIQKRNGSTFTDLPMIAGSDSWYGCADVSFTSDASYLAIACWYGDGALLKLANDGNSYSVAAAGGAPYWFSPEPGSAFMAAVTGGAAWDPGVAVYSRSGSTLTPLATLPDYPGGGHVDSMAWSADSNYLAISDMYWPYSGWISGVYVYRRSGTTFTRLPALDPAPGSSGAIALSENGTYLAVGASVYKRKGDQYTKMADPSPMPSGGLASVGFLKN